LAYKIAEKNFIKDGNNRVILATDGDFNVGISSPEALTALIEEKRESGVFLSVLGFGSGNLKDENMEKLADKGNGNYNYIDNILEGKKVLVKEVGGTLFTVAKDVKIQVEFNPKYVQSYKLIGYENRLLNNEDFNDDKKDAGEIGAGHCVTAIYELVLNQSDTAKPKVDDLKYQQQVLTDAAIGTELMNIKVRYKKPDGMISTRFEIPVYNNQQTFKEVSEDMRFAVSVAVFGMKLRNSSFVKDIKFDSIIDMCKASKGKDEDGYRAELIKMVETAQLLASK
jgi:Ca-activated chloride channel family protein